jgi:phage/plasmid-associated DNA primase
MNYYTICDICSYLYDDFKSLYCFSRSNKVNYDACKTYINHIKLTLPQINFTNGIYECGILRNALNNQINTGYDWVNFNGDEDVFNELNNYFELLFPDVNTRNYMLKFIASIIDGKTNDHLFHLWYGYGGDGKSVLKNLVMRTFGKYFGTLIQPVNNFKQLSDIENKRIIMIDENTKMDISPCMTQLDIMNHQTLGTALPYQSCMQLTSCDEICVRKLYQEQVIISPKFKLFAVCNLIPKMNASQLERIRIIPFMQHFNSTINYSQKYDTWKQAFMWLLIKRYYPIYISEGLVPSDEMNTFIASELLNNLMANTKQ